MIKIFSGTTNISLAKETAFLLNEDLGKIEIVRFENSETRVRILDDVLNKDVFIIQSCSNPTDQSYMEFFFIADALKRQGVKKITAVIPYFGYARQNKQHRNGEDVSAKVIIKFIEVCEVNKVYVFDIHDENTFTSFTISNTHLSSLELLADKVRSQFIKNNINHNNFIVVSPDQAGSTRAKKFSDAFFQSKENKIATVEKHRDIDKIHISQAVSINGDVKNKIAIIVDDIATSANTLINAANLVLKNKAKEVYAVVVHHDFSPDAHIKIQNSKIKKFFTSNSIELKKEQRVEKIKEISIASIISSVITSPLD